MDKGDAILCEEYTYPHIAESLIQPQGYLAVPLAMDNSGIVPSKLRQTLDSFRAASKPLPRLLYTVPVGQNPTGTLHNLAAPERPLLHAALLSLPKSAAEHISEREAAAEMDHSGGALKLDEYERGVLPAILGETVSFLAQGSWVS